jgi:phospholipase C
LAMNASFASGQAQSSARKGKAGDISQIQHIVIIVKQNNSFDHYFGAFPGVDGVTTGTLSPVRHPDLLSVIEALPRFTLQASPQLENSRRRTTVPRTCHREKSASSP